jgi:glycosyltransferase involved in cell wall biosynthesis
VAASSALTLRVGLIAETFDRHDGIARAGRQLISILGSRTDIELVLALPEAALQKRARALPANVADVVSIPHSGQIRQAAWVRWRLGGELTKRGVEIIHASKHVLPVSRVAGVLTVHDLTLLHNARQFRLAKRLLLPRQYVDSIERADTLVMHTQAVVDSVASYNSKWGSKARKVGLPFGGELFAAPAEAVNELVGTEFCLAVGDLSPRKNLNALIGVWPRVFKQTGMILVVVGSGGWKSEDTLRRIDSLVARGEVRRIVGASDASLRWMYEHATSLLYPSREEGYGLPIVEALAVGTQVISSTDPALVEVANGSALHLDPDDSQGWHDAIIAGARSAKQHHAPVIPSWIPTVETVAESLIESYGDALSTATSR